MPPVGSAAQDKELPEATSEPSSSCSVEEPVCRLCWSEAYDGPGGALISPCNCKGSLRYIHVRCLEDWQDCLRSQGNFKKARMCEICKEPYSLIDVPPSIAGNKQRFKALVGRINNQLLELFNSPSWGILIFRAWRSYTFFCGLYSAGRAGWIGLRAGVKLGRTLVEEQSSVIIQLLSTLAEFIGTPYAEVLWIQAVCGFSFALASELLYLSLLGLAGGVVYGFCRCVSHFLACNHATCHVITGCSSHA